MAIIKDHISIYQDIFKIPHLISGDIATIGFQDILGKNLPQDYNYPDFKKFLLDNKATSVTTIDPFDERSDIKYDLNLPIPVSDIEKYDSLIDIGSLEHIFDTKQALENCMKMVKVGGYYLLHTVVNGLSSHGLHTFNHLGLIDAFKLNGFDIKYLKYGSFRGVIINSPEQSVDASIWLIGQKTKKNETFVVPQQNFWPEANKLISYSSRTGNQIISFLLPKKIDFWFEQFCPPFIFRALKNIVIKIKILCGYKFLTKK